jgi:Domain of unknown function (DUF5916)/Carbohydrate family 9 binding domain-like
MQYLYYVQFKTKYSVAVRIFVWFFFSFLISLSAIAQKKNQSFQLHIQQAVSTIQIDGVMDEPAWQEADSTSQFFMVLPMDTSLAQVHTQVKMTYDSHNLYLIAVCYNERPGPYMVESLKRDFSFVKNDNFLLFMDTYDDKTNGFSFGANAAGAQWDGTMYEGGKVDLSWDNKWESVVKNYPDKWIFEAAIPFKSIRYKKGIKEWGINFSRNDLKSREKSSWAPVPRQFPTASLAYTGTLIWDRPPPEAEMNVSVIPYLLTGVSKDYENKLHTAFKKEAGVDTKIAVTSALNLDLTVNPDFSQVDVDKQVTNLNRYELFFPEKRQFFLENGDQFSNFGYASIRPFFSRRIGLTTPIDAGARLSGKLDKNWRIGVMDIQTRANDSLGLPAQNFSVLALQRKIFARSNIGFIFIDKESENYHPDTTSSKTIYSKYNRNIGLEYNLASANNLWTGKMLLLKSFNPASSGKNFVQAGHLQYSSRKWTILGQYEYVGTNYSAEVGYVPRHGYVKLNPSIAYNFFPAAGRVLSHGPQFSGVYYYDTKFNTTDNETVFSYLVTMRDRSTITGLLINDFVKLLAPFDPTNTGKDSLLTGSRHNWNTVGVDIVSRPQQLLTYTFSGRYGGYYANGKKLTLASDIGYRIQPYVSIIMSTSFNSLQLPAPWGNTQFWLIGPRIDATLTNKFFMTAFLQYNEQLKNMNLNARVQWRYKPASDLFLVYTDNYYPAPLAVRNRAFVLKWTYWWNL